MARLSNALLTGQAQSQSRMVPMVDLSYGGQNGYAPNLAEWASTTHYVRRNLVCLLLEAPAGFQLMQNPDFWVNALKSLVEVQAKSIDGFKQDLTVDVSSEVAVGGAGEMFQDFTNVTRARSEPVFTFTEKYGRPIQNFLSDWITYLIQDPDTKVPMLTTVADVSPNDLLADMYSMTCIFFEPDPTHTKVAKAWLTTNMYPKGTGEIVGKRDLTASTENLELSIEFTGVSQTGLGVVAFAQGILDSINMTNANPYMRAAFMEGITSDVVASEAQGYNGVTDTLSAAAVFPS